MQTLSSQEVFQRATASLNEAQTLMTHAHKIMKDEAEALQAERTVFQEASKKLEHVHFAAKVKLNVGGKIYKTSLQTLRKDPNSMLAAMFSGKFDIKPDDDDGSYFIDRDGKLFRYILNYLRNGQLICAEDEVLKRELLAEAKFYQIQNLIKQLSPTSFSVLSCIPEVEKHELAILSWLPRKLCRVSLIYHASTDGWGVKQFHGQCDNMGPTLIVVKYGNDVFGGYTDKDWKSPPGYTSVPDSNSFLFTLVNPSNTEPTKFCSKTSHKGEKGGLSYKYDLGPHFGASLADIRINFDGKSSRIGYQNLGNGFTSRQSTVFTCDSTFTMDELEVFQLIY